jgi:hypothetical protein
VTATRIRSHRWTDRYVLFVSYALHQPQLPVQITLGKLGNDGGVAQW